MRRTGRPNAGRSTNPTAAGALRPHRPAAAPTRRPASSPDVQRQRPAGRIIDAEDLDVDETDQQLADTRRVLFHRGPPVSELVSVNPDSGGPQPAYRGPSARSFPKSQQSSSEPVFEVVAIDNRQPVSSDHRESKSRTKGFKYLDDPCGVNESQLLAGLLQPVRGKTSFRRDPNEGDPAILRSEAV